MTKKTFGFSLIELVVVLVILGVLSVIVIPRFINLHRDAKIATLKATKGSIESAFDMFSVKVDLPRSNLTRCSANLQNTLNCIVINGIEIAYTKSDKYPVFNPYRDSINQLWTIMNIDVNNDVGGPYNGKLNYEDDYDGVATTNGFWIFPSIDGGYTDIDGYKCKIHYRPYGHTHNSTNRSEVVLEIEDC
ncbi:hypothetical protein Shal_1292 [Shewanella halifaxensis HAW-EB4]|uniref:Methylation site containing protein n=1 Tax=Shewanella halifaxensis (strain HAW-EB4) TaxID=458817 RepID=B0TKQ8_SHEHH|nr:prepilin-type N-terminal cleavage/methylation domain-containing protein [Shewanella halifaxensis]ABZ75860.1 hypothetical protein Shal_1292 [Shewanella halifaxensis HAW-EB4]